MHKVFSLQGSYYLLKDQRVFQHAIKPEDNYDGSPISLVLEGLYITHEASIPRESGVHFLNPVKVVFPEKWSHPTRKILDDFLNSRQAQIIVTGILCVYADEEGRLKAMLRANPTTPVSQ